MKNIRKAFVVFHVFLFGLLFLRVSNAQDIAAMEAVIDRQFMRWSSVWGVDRYVAASARVKEHEESDGDYRIGGQFTFIRFGAPHTIVYTAVLKNSTNAGLLVSDLCYYDNTSGMQDCMSRSASEQSLPVPSDTAATGIDGASGQTPQRESQEIEQADEHQAAWTRTDEYLLRQWEEDRARDAVAEQREQQEIRMEREQTDEYEAARTREGEYLQRQNESIQQGPDY